MAGTLAAPPVLSTPDTHILNETPIAVPSPSIFSEEELSIKYEIARTVNEIRSQKWHRIALQFPDGMLHDAPRVFQLLNRGLKPSRSSLPDHGHEEPSLSEETARLTIEDQETSTDLFILADTSYGSCCVDEVAAEHVNADAVVHYGRACLSPTSRLPVLHIFTQTNLDLPQVVSSFTEAIPQRDTKTILTADVPYASHVPQIASELTRNGYTNIFVADIIHDPASPIPNRTVPEVVREDESTLTDWHVYHISDPPTSLLLTLSSRVAEFHIFQTETSPTRTSPLQTASTSMMLRRRYALVTNLATVSIWGILINTLSVKNYLHIVDHVKDLIAAAGKKSYLFVVGKLNAAKVANFSEIGGWVVIGCWESSLIDSHDFYKPVITPFELKLALSSDADRVWTGEWRSDFQAVLDAAKSSNGANADPEHNAAGDDSESAHYDSEPESAPPEFDLRTGKYTSQSRPMHRKIRESTKSHEPSSSSALTKKTKGDLISINGTASPGAEFLRNKRTWQGLGSDFEVRYESNETAGSTIQEGRSGIARGYTVGSDAERR